MSFEMMNWASDQPVGHSPAKFVLLMLGSCANAETGVCFPSVAYLCEKTAQDRKTVIKNLERLIEWGCIEDTGERRGITRQVVVYRLRTEPRLYDEQENRNSSENGTVSQVSQDQSLTESSGDHENRNSSENGTVGKTGTVPETAGNSTNFARKESQIRDTEYIRKIRTFPARDGAREGSRATRLPESWMPSAELKAQAHAESPGVDLDSATVHFRRHFAAASGKLGESVDWGAKWLNWIARRAELDAHRPPPPAPASPRAKGKPEKPTPRQRLNEHLRYLAAEVAAGRMSLADERQQRDEWIAKLQPEIDAAEAEIDAHAA